MGKYRYALPQCGASLAHVFETMEAHKTRLGVINYAASQVRLAYYGYTYYRLTGTLRLLWLYLLPPHTYAHCYGDTSYGGTFYCGTHTCYSYCGHTYRTNYAVSLAASRPSLPMAILTYYGYTYYGHTYCGYAHHGNIALTMAVLTMALLPMQPTLEAIFLDICGAAAERSAPGGGGGGGGSGGGGGAAAAAAGGGGGGSPCTRVALALSPPMGTAEAVARPAAHSQSGVPLAKLATPVEFDGGGLQSC